MIKNDKWIREMAGNGMITPFEPQLIRKVNDIPVISYGVSSYGYDLRLSDVDFRVCRGVDRVVDPKKNYDWAYKKAVLCDGYFIIPANSYAMGVAVEKLEVPSDVIVTCLGKSTYARIGLIVNVTPAEPMWRGHLTLEFANASKNDIMVYANEGICQLLFFQGEPCETNYNDRNGKYQDQSQQVVLAKA